MRAPHQRTLRCTHGGEPRRQLEYGLLARADRQRGWTLLEIAVVILILGILASVVAPALDGVSPQYRLRAAARDVGSNINHVRSMASATGKTFAMHYDLERRKFWMIMPPEPEDDPEMDIEERPRGTVIELPTGVKFQEILLPDGSGIASGELDVVLDGLGSEGSHIIYLQNEDDQMISVKFNALLGYVDYFSEPVEFERYQ